LFKSSSISISINSITDICGKFWNTLRIGLGALKLAFSPSYLGIFSFSCNDKPLLPPSSELIFRLLLGALKLAFSPSYLGIFSFSCDDKPLLPPLSELIFRLLLVVLALFSNLTL
jgi:hypothetical protein